MEINIVHKYQPKNRKSLYSTRHYTPTYIHTHLIPQSRSP